MKLSKWTLTLGLLFIGLASLVKADGKVYSIPEVWEGSKDGATTGNPYSENGKAIWRVDQVWPADILNAANYIPMAWFGDTWKAAQNEFGGQPAAKITDNTITLGSRGSWEHGAPMEGAKVAALIFIAPADATYTVNGRVKADVWQGGDPFVLNVLNHSMADKKFNSVTTLSLAKGQDTALQEISVPMKAGDELIFVGSPMSNYAAANLIISGLQIK